MASMADLLRRQAASVASSVRASQRPDPRTPDGSPVPAPPRLSVSQAMVRQALTSAPPAPRFDPRTPDGGSVIPSPPRLTAPQISRDSLMAAMPVQSDVPLFRAQEAPKVKPWGVYETNYGPIAMPVSLGDRNEFRLMGDPITDERQIEQARASRFSIEKQSDEIKREIRLPDTPREAPQEANPTKRARFSMDEATRVVGDVIKEATAAKARADQEASAFALVRNTQTNTTELVPRDTLAAAPEGTFEVITPTVSAEEAQQISDLGLVGGPPNETIRGREDLPGGVMADPAELASAQMLEQRRSQAQVDAESARNQQNVREIQGRLFPADADNPRDYMVTVGDQADYDALPEPPTGYAWAIDYTPDGAARMGDETPEAVAYLVPYEVNEDGEIVEPFREGMAVIRYPQQAYDAYEDTPLDEISQWFEERVPSNKEIGEALEGGWEKIVETVGDVWGGVRNAVPQDVADWWDERIQGPATTILDNILVGGSIADDLRDVPLIGDVLADIAQNPTNQGVVRTILEDPGLGLLTAIAAPQQGIVTNMIDAEMNRIRGVESEATSDRVGGWLSNQFSKMPLYKDLPVWIRSNPEEATRVYESGYDSDEDGEADIFGSDAVYAYWMDTQSPEGFVGILYRIAYEGATDPLTWLPAAGVGGRVVRGRGQAIRMLPDAGPARRAIGSIIEGTGTVIQRGSRALEEVSDLGLGVVLDLAARVVRRTGATSGTQATKRQEALAEIGDTGSTILRRERRGNWITTVDRNGRITKEWVPPSGEPRTPDGAPSAPPPSQPTPPAPDAGDVVRVTADPRTRDGAETAINETEIPAGTVIETEDPGTVIRRTDDGFEVASEDAPPVPAETLAQAQRAANARLRELADEYGVPPRWVRREPQPGREPRAIDVIPQAAYNDLATRMADEWFESQDIQRSLGSGVSTHEHALESSRIALRTLEEMNALGLRDINWELTNSVYPLNATMEQAIRQPWTSRTGQDARRLLAGGEVTLDNGDVVRMGTVASPAPLPASGATPGQIRTANTYVDMMYNHARWNPDSFSNAEFRAAWQQAVDLDADLRRRGARRSPGGKVPPPLWEVTTPQGTTVAPTRGVPDAARQAAETTPEAQAAADAPDTRDQYESEILETIDGEELVRYYIDDDTFVDVGTIRYRDVPRAWRERYPNATTNDWYYAQVYAPPAAFLYAPTEAQVLADAVSTLRARGLVEGEGVDVVVEVEGSPAQAEAPQTQNAPRAESPAPRSDGFRPDQSSPSPKKLTRRDLPPVGETRAWRDYGVEVEAVEANGVPVYIARTADGEIAFTETKRGRYHVVNPRLARAGDIERIPFRLAMDDKQGVSLSMLGNHLYARREGVVNVPNAAAENPDNPQAPLQEAPGVPEQQAEPAAAANVEPAALTPDAQANPNPVPTAAKATARRVNQRRVRSATGPRQRQRLVRDLTPEERNADLPVGVRRSDRVLTVAPEVLRFDEALFQPRTVTLDWHIDQMARNWDDARAGTVDVIEIEPGQYTVVSGHHRTRAALRRNEMIARGEIEGPPVELDIKIHRRGDRAETIREGVRIGMLGNEGAVGQSPIDGARGIQQLRSIGHTDAEIAQMLGHGTRVDIVQRRAKLNELPPDLQAAITDNWDFRKGTVKNPHGMTESKGYDMTRLRDSGAVDNATLQQMYYDDVVATDVPLTDAEFTAYIDRKLTIAQEFNVQSATLFDTEFYRSEGGATIRDIEKQIAKQDAALDRERSAIERMDRRSGERFDEATRRDHQRVIREIESQRQRLLDDLKAQFRQNNPRHKQDIAALDERAEPRTVPANGGDQVVMDLTAPRDEPTPAREVVDRENSPTQRKKRQATKRQRAHHGEVTPAPDVDPESLTPMPRAPRHNAKDPTGTVDAETGETEWADADVPEMSPEARRILEEGGREPEGRSPAPDEPTTGQGGTVYSMLIPVNPKWITGGAHKVRQRVHATTGVPSRTHYVETNQGERYWLSRPITDQEIEVMTRHRFTNGDTFMDRVTKRVQTYGRKDNWRHFPEAYEIKAFQDTYAEMEVRLLELYPGYAVVKRIAGSRPYKALPSPVRKVLEGLAWVYLRLIGGMDRYAQLARDRLLLGHMRAIAYPGVQALGNTTNTIISGHPGIAARMWTKDSVTSAWALSRQRAKDMPEPWEHDISISPNQRLHQQLKTKAGREAEHTWQGQLGSIEDPLMGTKWMQQWAPTRALSKLAGSKKHARNAAMFDIVHRDTFSQQLTMQRLRNDAIPDYRNQTVQRLMDWGYDRADATRMWKEFIDGLGDTTWAYNIDDVINHFTPLIGEGRATRLGRDWQQAIYQVEKDVRSEVQRMTFAGGETRADAALKRVFLFHHFMSRQSWFYASQAAHHPFLINLYMNMQEELEKATEDWPDYLQGWVKLVGTPLGFQLFLSPVALAATFISFNYRTRTFENEGETGIGTRLIDLNNMLGLHPLLSVGGNLLGVFGDDFAPDPLFVWREAGLVTAAINWGRANGYIGDDITPQGNLYEQVMLDAREVVSGLNPWRDDAVESTSSEEQMDRQVQMLVVDEAMRDGLDPEDPEDMLVIQEAMWDPDSPYYQRAVKRWVNGELVEIGLRFTVGMFLPRMRPVNAAGEDLYHSFDRDMKALINTASPEVAEMRVQQDGYYEIGTDRQRQAADVWEQIAYGPMHHPITVGGVEYSVREIHEMSPEQRRQLADATLQEYGLLDDVQGLWDERDRFLAQPENARLAQQRQWSKAVREYPGGIDAYWHAAIDSGNENAAAYYESVMENPNIILDEQRDAALTNQFAYFAIGGIQVSVWDPVPEVTSGRFYDPVNIVGTAPQPTPYEEPNAEYATAIREGLPEALTDMETWDAEVQRVQQQLGIDPSIPFNELDKDTRRAIEDELEAEGIFEPDPPYAVKQYLAWAERQPRGADTSIDAYLAADRADYRESSTERLEESLAAPPVEQGPDRYGNKPPAPEGNDDLWQRILDLTREHDHTKYPETTGDDYWLFDHLP